MVTKPSHVIFTANSPPKKEDPPVSRNVQGRSPPKPQKPSNEKQNIQQGVANRLGVVGTEKGLLDDAYKEGIKEAFKETLKIRGKSAVEEAKKELIKEETKEKRKLVDLFKHSQEVLFRATSVFPFDFFPDELTIDVGKVNIIERIFFLSENIHSIAIKSIKDIAIETSLLFATLKVVPDGYPNNPIEVKFLKKGDAIRARNIIQGLLVADKEHIEPAIIEAKDLPQTLEEIGTVSTNRRL